MGSINHQRIAWLAMGLLTLLWLNGFILKAQWPNPSVDFGLFYAASRRVLDGQAALVYDTAAHVALQSRMYGIEAAFGLGFFYPPPALIFVSPLALVPFSTAFIIYLLAGLALFITLLRRITGDWLVALGMATSIGAPTQNIYLNHTGFLTASLLGGGLLALRHNKALAGIALGLLCMKPHLAVLALAMLLIWREWRALAWACGTGMVLLTTATISFGWDIWPAYLQASRDFPEILDIKYPIKLHLMLQSVLVLFEPWLGWTVAGIIHAAVALGAAGLAMTMRQRDTQIAAVLCATALISPFLFLYDTLMLVVAAALILRAQPRLLLPVIGAMLISSSWYIILGSKAPFTALALLMMAWLVERSARRGPTPSTVGAA